ncbi:MAG: hypothetical protein NT023_21860 [Armatimonadetes bacterium]|nr:hypothetical protein [Armatimonadota bacterium]
MATLIKTGITVKFEFGMGTVFATIRNKVWKCEGAGIPEQALRIYERALQADIKKDTAIVHPATAASRDFVAAQKAAERHGGSILELTAPEMGENSPSNEEVVIY